MAVYSVGILGLRLRQSVNGIPRGLGHAMQRALSAAPQAMRSESVGDSGYKMTDGHMYNWRVRAVLNALKLAGKADGPLEVSDLSALGHLDQYHYLGTEACDHVATLLKLNPNSKCLDVGSGIGGPARYLSALTGCAVVGVEFQPDLAQAAVELTRRVKGLSDRVCFVTGDMSDPSLRLPGDGDGDRVAESFDHFISLLVNLHVPDRPALLRNCFDRLKPGGTFVIEDFAQNAPLLAVEEDIVSELVSAPTVTSVEVYLDELRRIGFVDLQAVDMSAPWTAWTKARHELYAASEAETVALHGQALFESRVLFYQAIDDLFAGGRLGGVKLTGRKPGGTHAVNSTINRPAALSQRVAGDAGGASTAPVNIIEGKKLADHMATAPLASRPAEARVE